MVLLIDTNVILDVLLNRPDFVKDSSMIWKLCEAEQARGYVSALTFANLVYIMRKELDPEKIDEVYRKRSEEHTSELQSRFDLVCRLLLEKKKNKKRS